MESSINLYSTKEGEIEKFLTSFYNKNIELENNLKYKICFGNPIEMIDMIGTFIENNEKYQISIWISFDKHVYVNVTEHNIDKIIKYIYERFPY